LNHTIALPLPTLVRNQVRPIPAARRTKRFTSKKTDNAETSPPTTSLVVSTAIQHRESFIIARSNDDNFRLSGASRPANDLASFVRMQLNGRQAVSLLNINRPKCSCSVALFDGSLTALN
jgi:hypothetical protein